jgi:myo-inositol 2-dehydrogenase / D-chiro-inositol 1-dehydrogenase
MSSPLALGLIGAGRIGQVHASTIVTRVPGARLLAVADVNLDAARACAARFAIPKAVVDPLEVINDPAITAVMICSLTSTHATLIEAAARAGKHIFCEKPVALNIEDTDRAVAAADTAGVQLQIGFNRRFDANYARVRKAVTSGEIGKPYMLHIISRDPAPPPIEYVRGSGGLFADMTIHDFDMARFLTGSEAVEIYTQTDVNVDPAIGEAGDIDTALCLIRFANGIIATIDNCRKAVYGYDQRVEMFGSGGAISIGNNYPNSATLSTAESIHTDLPLNFFMHRYVEAYAAEIEEFAAAISAGKPVPVTGHDGRAAFALAMAAKQSMLEKRPVSLV